MNQVLPSQICSIRTSLTRLCSARVHCSNGSWIHLACATDSPRNCSYRLQCGGPAFVSVFASIAHVDFTAWHASTHNKEMGKPTDCQYHWFFVQSKQFVSSSWYNVHCEAQLSRGVWCVLPVGRSQQHLPGASTIAFSGTIDFSQVIGCDSEADQVGWTRDTRWLASTGTHTQA